MAVVVFDQFLQLVEVRQRHSSAPLIYCFYMGASTLPSTEIGLLGLFVLADLYNLYSTAVLGKRRNYLAEFGNSLNCSAPER